MDNNSSDDNEKPGSRKPSRAHLFQKGVCPNQLGRGYKKGPAPGEQFVKMYSQTVVAGDGRRRTRMQILVDSLTAGALAGELDTIEGLIDMRTMWSNGGGFQGDGTREVTRSSSRVAKVMELHNRMLRRKYGRRRR
jgi:hypothetical protein